jgi:hypothetical protein
MSFFDQLQREALNDNRQFKIIYDPLRDRDERWYARLNNPDGNDGYYFAYHESLEKCSHKLLEAAGYL